LFSVEHIGVEPMTFPPKRDASVEARENAAGATLFSVEHIGVEPMTFPPKRDASVEARKKAAGATFFVLSGEYRSRTDDLPAKAGRFGRSKKKRLPEQPSLF
jgi:uncharacterized cupin superfamily protein